MKRWLHNQLGRLWHWLGTVLQRTKHWDRT